MDTWNRITNAAQIIAEKRGVDVPAEFTKVSGNPWEREKKLKEALCTFCASLALPVPEKSEDVDANAMADILDEMALELLPEERSHAHKRRQKVSDEFSLNEA